jgi:PAS domain S-box-containing protein
MLYQVAFEEEKARLTETAQSQARLLEAVARFDTLYSQNYPEGPGAATLSQIRDAHQNYAGFGQTGEFTLAKLEDDMMVFLLSHRHFDRDLPQPVPFDSELAEPMRRSLSGQSGTVVGLDYRGETVLAAYEPVAGLDWGIVAKIDLAEIRTPFIRASLIAGLAAIAVIIFGALLFLRITTPLLQQLQESEEKYRRLTENARDVIYRMSLPDGVYEYVNPAAVDVFGYPPEAWYDNPLLTRQFIHPDWQTYFEKQWAKLIAGDMPPFYEYQIIHKSGESRWMHQRNVLVCNEDGRPIAIEGIVTDITKRKQTEAALREYSERLTEMVEERTMALEAAQEKLVRREKLAVLGQLAGSVAHELRHPLGILTNAVYFLNLTLTEADETTKEYLDMMSAEIRKSEKIISDLLNFSRAKSSEKREIAVSELVGGVLAKHPPSAQIEVSNQIDANVPPAVVDPQQIEQVITNLIINAYQAMPEGGKLTIEATGIAKKLPEAGKVSIAFTDTGGGIPPDHMDKLFEPLFTTKSRGIGLGLVVSKNLLETNGGAIKVESEEGHGSTFTIFLPAEFGGDHE